MRVLKFAVRRQLSRWGNKRDPTERQRAQGAALRHVLHVLQDDAFAGGCTLHARDEE